MASVRFSWEGSRTRQMAKWNNYYIRKYGEEAFADNCIRRCRSRTKPLTWNLRRVRLPFHYEYRVACQTK